MGCCEHGNEPSVSLQCSECFDCLSDCELLKTDLVRVRAASSVMVNNVASLDETLCGLT